MPPWILVCLAQVRPKGSTHPGITVTSSQHALLKRVVETSDAISGAPRRVVEPELESGRLALVRLSLKPIHIQAIALLSRGTSLLTWATNLP